MELELRPLGVRAALLALSLGDHAAQLCVGPAENQAHSLLWESTASADRGSVSGGAALSKDTQIRRPHTPREQPGRR